MSKDCTVHEQVKMQLAHLKYLVDAETKRKEECDMWGIKYTPSNRKWADIELYKAYKDEVERNGDKNLIVMVKLCGDGGLNMYGTYPFARRYVHEEHLVYRDGCGEVLLKEGEVKVGK